MDWLILYNVFKKVTLKVTHTGGMSHIERGPCGEGRGHWEKKKLFLLVNKTKDNKQKEFIYKQIFIVKENIGLSSQPMSSVVVSVNLLAWVFQVSLDTGQDLWPLPSHSSVAYNKPELFILDIWSVMST